MPLSQQEQDELSLKYFGTGASAKPPDAAVAPAGDPAGVFDPPPAVAGPSGLVLPEPPAVGGGSLTQSELEEIFAKNRRDNAQKTVTTPSGRMVSIPDFPEESDEETMIPIEMPSESYEVSFYQSLLRGMYRAEEAFGNFSEVLGHKMSKRNIISEAIDSISFAGITPQHDPMLPEKMASAFFSVGHKIKKDAEGNLAELPKSKDLRLPGESLWDLLGDKDRSWPWLKQAIGENLAPMWGALVVAGGAGMVTRLTGGNPAVVSSLAGGMFAGGVETGFSYKDLIEMGVKPEDAADTALLVGATNAMLEMMPLGEILSDVGITAVRKKMLEKFVEDFVDQPQLRTRLARIMKIAAMEGSTEGLQEIVGNMGKRVYNENQNLMEGVDEATFLGAILGGKTQASVEVGGATYKVIRDAKKKRLQKQADAELSLPSLDQELEGVFLAAEEEQKRLDRVTAEVLSGEQLTARDLPQTPVMKKPTDLRQKMQADRIDAVFDSVIVLDSKHNPTPLKNLGESERAGKVYLRPYGTEQTKVIKDADTEIAIFDEKLEQNPGLEPDTYKDQVDELNAKKDIAARTLQELPGVLFGVKHSLQNYLREMLPDYTIIVSDTSVNSTTGRNDRGGGSWADAKRKIAYINLNLEDGLMVKKTGGYKKSHLVGVMNHEFGHVLLNHYFSKAPEKVQKALEQEYLRFLKKYNATTSVNERAATLDAPGVSLAKLAEPHLAGDPNARFDERLFDDKTDIEIQKYATSFDEWFAQQVARYKNRHRRGIAKVFNSVRRAFERFMKLHPENFAPNATVEQWLNSLAANVKAEAAQRRIDDLTPKNVLPDAHGVLRDDAEMVSDRVFEGVFGSEGQAVPTGDITGTNDQRTRDLDQYRTDMNRFKRWTLTLVQAAKRNLQIAGLQKFVNLAAESEIITRKYHHKVDENLRRWRKLGKKQGAALSEFAIEANLKSWEKGYKLSDPELVQLAKQMPGEKMTTETFEFYQHLQREFEGNLNELEAAINEQIDRTYDLTSEEGENAAQEARETLARQMQEARKRNYFPTSRFGDYTVTVRAREELTYGGREYKKEQVVVFETYPTAKLAKRRQKQLAKFFKEEQYSAAVGKLDKDQRDYVGLPLPLLEVLRKIVPEQKKKVLEEAIARHLPGHGYAKRYAGFHGVLGASKDGARSYANYTGTFGRMMMKVKLADQMDKSIESVRKTLRKIEMNGGDVLARQNLVDMMQHQRDYIINPKFEWQWLSALAFNMYLAFIPGKVVLNGLQVPTVVMPYMNKRYGEAKTFKAMMKSPKDLWTFVKHPEEMPQHVVEAITRMMEEGVISQSMYHEMAGLESAGPISARIPAGDMKGYALNTIRLTSILGSWLWNKSENLFRSTTALAMYQLEIENGASPTEAYHRTVDGIRESFFEYSRWNRPRFMQGNLRALTIFYTHMQHMIEYVLGPHEAKWQVLGMMLLIGGIQGMPGVEDAEEMLTFIFQKTNSVAGREIFPPDARVKFREMINDMMVEITDDPQTVWTDAILRGSSRYSLGLAEAGRLAHAGFVQAGMDEESLSWLKHLPEFDIHSSVSLGRIIPGLDAINAPDTNTLLSRLAQGTAGAGLGIPINIIKAMYDTNATDMQRWRTVLPSFLGNWSKAYEYASHEEAQDAKGNHLARFDVENERHMMELAAQVLGFNTTRVNIAKEANWAFKGTRMYYQRRRAEIYRLYAEAMMEGDTEGMDRVIARAQQFNKDTPRWAWIDQAAFKQGVENRVLGNLRAKMGLPTGPGVRDYEIKEWADSLFPPHDE